MIDPLKIYTMTDVQKLAEEGHFPVRSSTLYKLLKSGRIIGMNVSRGKKVIWRIKGEELLRYMSSLGPTAEGK